VLGIELSDGLSAWKHTVRRPGWERLLARVKSGESDGCVVWHTDRLFRQPRDLEALIELAEHGYRVFSAHGERDLADPDDRFILRIEVAHAARSSDDTSRRLKRRFETFRAQGRTTGGPRTLGFPGKDTAWTPGEGQTKADRPDVSPGLVAAERAALLDAAVSMVAGVSAATIVERWNSAGLRTVAGREWIHATVSATMKRVSLGGYIVHEGTIVGRLPGDPILDKQTFDRLQALIAGRKRGRKAGESYVGTGILRCGVCGEKLSARSWGNPVYEDGTRRGNYFCVKQRRGCGTVFVDRWRVDQELPGLVVERATDKRHAKDVEALRTEVEGRLKAVRGEIAEIKALQDTLWARVGARTMTIEEFDIVNEPLAPDRARLEAERDALIEASPQGPGRPVSAATLEAEWINGDLAERRAILNRALDRDKLVVFPSQVEGRKAFDQKRMRPVKPEAFAQIVAEWARGRTGGLQ
jgi:hypothetical protein